jgi:hypothetical protein
MDGITAAKRGAQYCEIAVISLRKPYPRQTQLQIDLNRRFKRQMRLARVRFALTLGNPDLIVAVRETPRSCMIRKKPAPDLIRGGKLFLACAKPC